MPGTVGTCACKTCFYFTNYNCIYFNLEKMRGYFPSHSADGKSYAIRQECAIPPILEHSPTQESTHTFGIPHPLDNKKRLAFSGIICPYHTAKCAVSDTLKSDFGPRLSLTSPARTWLWHFIDATIIIRISLELNEGQHVCISSLKTKWHLSYVFSRENKIQVWKEEVQKYACKKCKKLRKQKLWKHETTIVEII